MAGLNLGVGFRVNADAALRKRPRKLTEAYAGSNPIPAARPGPTSSRAFSPGHHAPNPVPAVSAEECYIEPFRPGVSFAVDPVPARSA